MDKSDTVKQGEMTQRWAAKNNRQDARKQRPDTNRRVQVEETFEATQRDNIPTHKLYRAKKPAA